MPALPCLFASPSFGFRGSRGCVELRGNAECGRRGSARKWRKCVVPFSQFQYFSPSSCTRPSCHGAGGQPIKKGGDRPPLGGTEGQRRESKRAAPVLTGDAASAVPWCTPASLKHAAGRSDAVPAAPNLRGVLAAAQRRSEQLLPALRIAPSREYL